MRYLLLLLCCSLASADENAEVTRLAPKYKAEAEVTLWDRTRVDLLTDEYAIEVDYADKWAEGIGQSLYYGIAAGRKPGLILLVEDVTDHGFVHRAQAVCAKHDIRLWIEVIDGQRTGRTDANRPDGESLGRSRAGATGVRDRE